ncbi:MAG: hypothetical protein AB7S50_12515 [Bacteroidales bacterium]
MHHIKLKIISILLISLVGGIIFNSAFFIHTHRTACGKIIVHAHPFNKSAENSNPLSKHQHNKIDLTTLSSLDYFFNSFSDIQINYYPEHSTELNTLDKNCTITLLSFSLPNRAPPVNSAC